MIQNISERVFTIFETEDNVYKTISTNWFNTHVGCWQAKIRSHNFNNAYFINNKEIKIEFDYDAFFIYVIKEYENTFINYTYNNKNEYNDKIKKLSQNKIIENFRSAIYENSGLVVKTADYSTFINIKNNQKISVENLDQFIFVGFDFFTTFIVDIDNFGDFIFRHQISADKILCKIIDI